jgi:hypothetical protein
LVVKSGFFVVPEAKMHYSVRFTSTSQWQGFFDYAILRQVIASQLEKVIFGF